MDSFRPRRTETVQDLRRTSCSGKPGAAQRVRHRVVGRGRAALPLLAGATALAGATTLRAATTLTALA
ncbi:hypothetical protein JM949_17935 [Micromonospora sp. STR1s_6]|uniref:Uncharacterized protein n=1 Tax=Micromonospora tarensis TaxID=2806100 RepID=A0ABS1YIE3_9ACTN|nr:hypothetical protein [Micromonospora tarensis]